MQKALYDNYDDYMEQQRRQAILQNNYYAQIGVKGYKKLPLTPSKWDLPSTNWIDTLIMSDTTVVGGNNRLWSPVRKGTCEIPGYSYRWVFGVLDEQIKPESGHYGGTGLILFGSTTPHEKVKTREEVAKYVNAFKTSSTAMVDSVMQAISSDSKVPEPMKEKMKESFKRESNEDSFILVSHPDKAVSWLRFKKDFGFDAVPADSNLRALSLINNIRKSKVII
jgi:hypothetical protein